MAYFEDDDKFTQQGTKEIIEFYKDKYIFADLQKDKWFQQYDIDFVLIDKSDNQTCKVEIKCDRYTSGNIYLETVSNNNKSTLGCMLITQSDYIFYYFANWKKLYVFKTKALQKWLNENKDKNRFGIAHPQTKDKYTGVTYYRSTGLVVPIGTFLIELGKQNYQIRKLA